MKVNEGENKIDLEKNWEAEKEDEGENGNDEVNFLEGVKLFEEENFVDGEK